MKRFLSIAIACAFLALTRPDLAANDQGDGNNGNHNGNKVTMCHYQNGMYSEIQVKEKDVAEHLAAGDTLGSCVIALPQ